MDMATAMPTATVIVMATVTVTAMVMAPILVVVTTPTTMNHRYRGRKKLKGFFNRFNLFGLYYVQGFLSVTDAAKLYKYKINEPFKAIK